MIYAMSDIHGYLSVLRRNMELLDLTGSSKLLLLGDYIDYGPESGQTLRYIRDLQRRHGDDKVIVLRGNHEDMFLDWLDTYTDPRAGLPDEYLTLWNDWLTSELGTDTVRTLLSEEQWAFFRQISRTASEGTLNMEAAQMVLASNRELIRWLRGLPYYYETDTQIFVHAGVDEEAGEWWALGTEESFFTGKYPPSTGRFYKDIIAGHVGTAMLANNRDFHGVYHDGQSHYYIDGTVNESGRIPILTYDEASGKYWEMKYPA